MGGGSPLRQDLLNPALAKTVGESENSKVSDLYQSFEEHAARHGSKNAIVSRAEGLRLCFDEVVARVEDWVGRLRDLPAGPVALATGNCAAFFELFLALRILDRPVLSVDAATRLDERIEAASRLGCNSLLVRAEASALPEEAARADGPDPQIFWLPIDSEGRNEGIPAGTAVIKMTSGSTGAPNGVCLSEASLLAGARQIGQGMKLTTEDRVLVAIPLSHSYGFDNGVLSLAVLGTALILESPTYLNSLLQGLVEEGATFFPTVPPLVHFLAESEWPTGHQLRTVICAGGRLDSTMADRFFETTGLAVHQFYGSTETGGISFESSPRNSNATGTVGHPLPGVTIRLTDQGQVEVHSAANHGGRAGDPSPLRPGPVLVGDLAEWTPEGRLRITGRAGDFVNVCGRRVSLPAIEASLRALDGVDQVAVLATQDPVRGERLAAFVVGPQERLEPKQLPAGLSLRDIRHLEGLPYTERGKLDRRRLRQLAGEIL